MRGKIDSPILLPVEQAVHCRRAFWNLIVKKPDLHLRGFAEDGTVEWSRNRHTGVMGEQGILWQRRCPQIADEKIAVV